MSVPPADAPSSAVIGGGPAQASSLSASAAVATAAVATAAPPTGFVRIPG